MLSFKLLTWANMRRLPLFKNRHGGNAHSTMDGHDWSPAQWFQAVVGELGELAQARVLYEKGSLTDAQFKLQAEKETADVQIYLLILAKRFLDKLTPYPRRRDFSDVPLKEDVGWPFDDSIAQSVMRVVAHLGDYCNTRKKFERGDYSLSEYLHHSEAALELLCASVNEMCRDAHGEIGHSRTSPSDKVEQPHPTGITLDEACISKFNEVSLRVGAPICIRGDGSSYILNGVEYHCE